MTTTVKDNETYSHLLWSPDIEIDRLDFAYMRAHGSMNARASDAQEDTTTGRVSLSISLRGYGTYRFQDAHRGSTKGQISLWENPSRVDKTN